jgi:hypothetical protein
MTDDELFLSFTRTSIIQGGNSPVDKAAIKAGRMFIEMQDALLNAITDEPWADCFDMGHVSPRISGGMLMNPGRNAYQIVAWDLLGCLVERGLLLVIRSPKKKTKKPWLGGTSWAVVRPQEESK